MNKHKVVRSEDVTTIVIKGSRKHLEPGTAIIEFPGGCVEVSRCSDGSYWAHTTINEGAHKAESRMDYDHEEWTRRVENNQQAIPNIPGWQHVRHIAVRIATEKPS